MLILGFGEERLGLPFIPPPAEAPLAGLPDELVEAVRAREVGRFSRGEGDEKRWYVAEVSVIERAGSCWDDALLVVIHDETESHDLLLRMEALAQTDGLTGLANRRRFMCNRFQIGYSLGPFPRAVKEKSSSCPWPSLASGPQTILVA